MKCFNHPTVDAVGVCKSCGRALCHDCIAEVGLSCSCKGRCESMVTTLNDMVQRGSTAYLKTSASYRRIGILVVLLGCVFFLSGIGGLFSQDPSTRTWAYFTLVGGALFGGMGVSYLISAKKFRQK